MLCFMEIACRNTGQAITLTIPLSSLQYFLQGAQTKTKTIHICLYVLKTKVILLTLYIFLIILLTTPAITITYALVYKSSGITLLLTGHESEVNLIDTHKLFFINSLQGLRSLMLLQKQNTILSTNISNWIFGIRSVHFIDRSRLSVEVCSGCQILLILSMCCRLAGLSHTRMPKSCCPRGTSGDLKTEYAGMDESLVLFRQTAGSSSHLTPHYKSSGLTIISSESGSMGSAPVTA